MPHGSATPPHRRSRAPRIGGHPSAPEATLAHRDKLNANPFLRRIYAEWYRGILSALPAGEGGVLEIGSGPGFLRGDIPEAITSEVFAAPGCDLILDAHELPFGDDTMRAIVMTNVFHHLRDPGRFLCEATRCLRPGGRIVAVEPWVTAWSRLVYGILHHERFDPGGPWCLPAGDPLFQANNALAWIVFHRDRTRLSRGFPRLRLVSARPMMPLAYLLSGGMRHRPLAPGWSYPFWRALEGCATPFLNRSAMFALITVEKLGTFRG